MTTKEITIQANNKCLSFAGSPAQAIDFVDYMHEVNHHIGGDYENLISDFLYNIEVELQNNGYMDRNFNPIKKDEKDYPEVYSGILKSGAEVMLRQNGDNEWTVDVRDRNDEYILGFQFYDYNQALREYSKLEEEFNMARKKDKKD